MPSPVARQEAGGPQGVMARHGPPGLSSCLTRGPASLGTAGFCPVLLLNSRREQRPADPALLPADSLFLWLPGPAPQSRGQTLNRAVLSLALAPWQTHPARMVSANPLFPPSGDQVGGFQ